MEANNSIRPGGSPNLPEMADNYDPQAASTNSAYWYWWWWQQQQHYQTQLMQQYTARSWAGGMEMDQTPPDVLKIQSPTAICKSPLAASVQAPDDAAQFLAEQFAVYKVQSPPADCKSPTVLVQATDDAAHLRPHLTSSQTTDQKSEKQDGKALSATLEDVIVEKPKPGDTADINSPQRSLQVDSDEQATHLKPTLLEAQQKQPVLRTSTGSSADLTISTKQRVGEIKKLREEMRTFYIDLAIDTFDCLMKMIVYIQFSMEEMNLEEIIGIAMTVVLVVAMLVLSFVIYQRVLNLKELAFVAEKGFSYKWKVQGYTFEAKGGTDPRIERDSTMRRVQRLKLRTGQAVFADLPWAVTNIIRLSTTTAGVRVSDLLSIASAGFGVGVKFTTIIEFCKLFLYQDKPKVIYESLPANVLCASGVSNDPDTLIAVTTVFESITAQLTDKPSWIFITMTANHDHEAGIAKLRELAPDIPYSGLTTCQGVLHGSRSCRDGQTCIAMWAICDTEGVFATGCFEAGDDAESSANEAMQKVHGQIRGVSKTDFRSCGKKPSFVWVNPSPGIEDNVLSGFARAVGSKVPMIGGTAADNDVTGKWKQWASNSVTGSVGCDSGTITNGGCSFMICYCSASVKGALYTGYNASAHVGVVTKIDGPRHILEIDHRSSTEVYNEWTGGALQNEMEQEEANVLGISSLFPLGQRCGSWEGEPYYRVMHPHLFKKATKSVTVFADVKEGENIVMMSGTKENLVNRIAQISSHVVRQSNFTTQEVRGALVIFCGGAMMYASDQMDTAAEKLYDALGGTPYVGIHTFGEQGQFPDGTSRHGNLMFSAVVFSSKRRVMKVMNMDTGEVILEDDPRFEEILLSGGLDN